MIVYKSRSSVYFHVFFLIVLVNLIIFGTVVKASEIETATVEEADPENKEPKPYDPEQEVDIVINLEDETRYMGVTVYRIGDYDGERFTYSPEVLECLGKDYYKLSRESEIVSNAKYLEELIPETLILEGQDVNVEQGIGTADGLTPGLYLVVQNKADHNANLDAPYIVETPQWSEENLEWMYDLRTYPKWEREVWFTFRPQIVVPMVWGALLLLLVVFCFMGARVIRGVFMGCLFFLFGYLGLKLATMIDQFEAQFMWYFVIFLVFAFLGTGITWDIISVISSPLKKIRAHKALRKQLFWITSLIGAILIGLILHNIVFHKWLPSIGIAAGIGILGCIVQRLKRDREVRFYTYDDLLKLEEGDPRMDELMENLDA